MEIKRDIYNQTNGYDEGINYPYNGSNLINSYRDKINDYEYEIYDCRNEKYNRRDKRNSKDRSRSRGRNNQTNRHNERINYPYNDSNLINGYRDKINDCKYESKDIEKFHDKYNSIQQTEGIISIYELLENIRYYEEFVEMYGANRTFKNFSDACYNQTFKNTFKNFSDACYNQTFKNTFKNFSDACYFILKNQITSVTIANFVNGGAKLLKQIQAFNKKDADTFKKIATKISQLIVDGTIKLDTFWPQELANTFNGLAQCGINLGEYLKGLNPEYKNALIGALVDRIQFLLNKKGFQEQFNFTSQELANTFNGLAKCGVDLGEYLNRLNSKDKNKFIGALVDRIQTLLSKNDFDSQAIANTFNGLAKCDVNLGRYVDDTFIGALVGRIQKLLNEKQFTSQELANTFNGLAQCGVNLGRYVDDIFIGALVDRIQTLLKEINFQKQFEPQHIANTFNGLAQCGVNLGEYFETTEGENSKNEFIEDLVDKIQDLLNKEQFTSQAIANTFNGLAQCGINLGEYLNKSENEKLKNDFIKDLVVRIRDLLPRNDFNSQAIANTFNGLAKCGVNLGEYFKTEGKESKDVFIKDLVDKIQDLLNKEQFTSQELANTFNGLVKLFLYNKDLYEENIGQFKNIINNLVQKYFKLLDRNDQRNRTMLYNIKYLQACGFKINNEILSKISNLKPGALNEDHINSALEKNFETFLSEILESKDCYEQESKLTFQVTSNASFQRSIDFCIEFTYKGKTYKAYIELDGPSHFIDIEQKQKTPQTQIRDIITLQKLQEEQETLSKKGNNTQILYVTLSANEFNKIKDNIKVKERLFNFLIKKDQLKQITKKTSNNNEMDNKDKSIYNSLENNKITDDIYGTPTQESVVSKLVRQEKVVPETEQEKQVVPKTKQEEQSKKVSEGLKRSSEDKDEYCGKKTCLDR